MSVGRERQAQIYGEGVYGRKPRIPTDFARQRTDLPVLLKGVLRPGGADVFKALALDADVVLIGRPHVYGLALGDRDGAWDAVANIVAELDLTLGPCGLQSIAELDPDALRKQC